MLEERVRERQGVRFLLLERMSSIEEVQRDIDRVWAILSFHVLRIFLFIFAIYFCALNVSIVNGTNGQWQTD